MTPRIPGPETAPRTASGRHRPAPRPGSVIPGAIPGAIPAGRRAPALFLGLCLAAAGAIALPVLADPDGERPLPPRSAQTTTPDSPATPAAPLRCEVALDPVGGGTRIEGRVHSDRPVVGTYALAVTSRSAGGQASIRQAGDFAAAPHDPARLGSIRLSGAPAAQTVDLQIRVEGQTLRCRPAPGL